MLLGAVILKQSTLEIGCPGNMSDMANELVSAFIHFCEIHAQNLMNTKFVGTFWIPQTKHKQLNILRSLVRPNHSQLRGLQIGKGWHKHLIRMFRQKTQGSMDDLVTLQGGQQATASLGVHTGVRSHDDDCHNREHWIRQSNDTP